MNNKLQTTKHHLLHNPANRWRIWGLLAFFITSTAFAQTTTTFSYTGTMQTYTVPAGITSITVDVRGAQGQSAYTTGGNGGRVQGSLSVTPSEVLNLYVGGQNGYNGGGAPTVVDGTIFLGAGDIGGSGGNTIGGAAPHVADNPDAQGSIQLIGGAGGQSFAVPNPFNTGSNGSLGVGGTNNGSGSGGGYYGGDGSSYIDSTIVSTITLTQGYNAGDGSIIITTS
jgi:hypothetical protein